MTSWSTKKRLAAALAGAGLLVAAAAFWRRLKDDGEEMVDEESVRLVQEEALKSICESEEAERNASAEISSLYIYPVKSMKGVAVKCAQIGRRGLKHDRRWMVVDDKGSFLSQRRIARMALVEVAVDEDSSGKTILMLSSPSLSLERIAVPLNLAENAIVKSPVRVWDDFIEGVHDQGDEAALWLDGALRMKGTRLVYMSDDCVRKVSEKYAVSEDDITGFSDGYPFLVISTASLIDLNKRIFSKAPKRMPKSRLLTRPLEMNRFRPNIVLGGLDPYQEDSIHELKFSSSGVNMRVVKPCSRCKMITIDQELGKTPRSFMTAEPINTLSTFRKREEDVFLGQNAIWVPTETVNEETAPYLRVGEVFSVNMAKSANVQFG